MIEVRQYIDPWGRIPFERWFDKLDITAQARVAVAINRMRNGNLSAAKGIGTGVFELRLDFGPGYRIYFGKEGKTIVILLGGGTKQRQQADIDVAHKLWQEHKQRKREA